MSPLDSCCSTHSNDQRYARSMRSFLILLQCLLCASLSALLSIAPTPLLAQHAPNPSADFSEAQSLLQQGRLHEAKTSALDALRHHPSSVEGYNLLGIIESDLQDFPAALNAFGKALKIAPNSVKTHNNVGDLFVAAKQFNDAEREFRIVLRLDPADANGNYNLGVLLMAKGAPAEAIPHFEKVRPQNTPTEFNLIRAYFETKRPADALQLAAKLSAQSKDNVQVHFSLGTLLAAEKQYKEAQGEFEQADALQPGTFEIIYNLGETYLREREYAKAELTLNRALKLKPDSVDASYVLAQAYADDAHPLDALNLLITAHKMAPENVDVIFLMARLMISQNFLEDAIPLLEAGLKIAPRRPDLLAALGESYFLASNIDNAVRIFKQLIEVEPSARSYGFVALSYRNLGRFDEAKQYVLKGLSLDPHNINCLFNLGLIEEGQRDRTKAAAVFEQILRLDPDFPDALLELANIRIANQQFQEAVSLLQRYVRIGHDLTSGYYKLALAERSLHQTAAASRDIGIFQALSKNKPAEPHPYEDLFDYLNRRSQLDPHAQGQLDIADLTHEIQRHPDQPEDLYFLAQAYLNAGKVEDARNTIDRLDQLAAEDYRTLTGAGVLLARFHLYDDAIRQFQAALKVNPNSDDVKFDLANTYFHKHLYSESLEIAQQESDEGKKDNAYQALLGDLYAHLGNVAPATQIFQDSINRNPDSDQAYLSLALLDLRQGNVGDAEKTLQKGQARIPDSGKMYWGLGLTSALQGDSTKAAGQLERAVDLLPDWSASYSTLGVLYFETGQIDKAREVLSRFKNSGAHSSLDIDRIEQVLVQASPSAPSGPKTMSDEEKAQFLQLALSLADRTL